MNTDKYFKALAAEYVRVKGAELQRELAEISQNEPDELIIAHMDARINAAIIREKSAAKNRKLFLTWGAMAASLFVVIFSAALYFNYFQNNMTRYESEAGSVGETTASAPAPETSIADAGEVGTSAIEMNIIPPPAFAFISLTAPEGWHIEYIDFDGDVAIYHLLSDMGNRVVVLAGEPIYSNEESDFMEIFIHSKPAYMRVENTHSILFFDMQGYQLVLSTEYEYADLITLAEFWI